MAGGGAAAGSTALTLVGNLVGSYIGGPIGGVVGSMAGGLIGSMLFNRARKPLIPDWQLASSSYGKPIPIIYGQVRLPAVIFWMSPITTSIQNVGKALGAQQGYNYYQSAAMAFCYGPAQILKIWTDGKIYWDSTSSNPFEYITTAFTMRFYPGDEEQGPDPTVAAWVEANVIPGAACPAYRGLCYSMFGGVNLIHFGNRFPNVTALVSGSTEVQILVTELTRLPADISTDTSIKAVMADWQRNVCYHLSNGDVLRAYDLNTGKCTVASLWNNPAGTSDPISAIACVQGGWIYATSGAVDYGSAHYTPNMLFKIDPITLTPVGDGVLISYGGFLEIQGVTMITAFTLAGPTFSSFDLVAGSLLFGGFFIADPNSGYSTLISSDVSFSNPLHGGIGSNTTAIVGKQDLVNGTVDVWVIFTNDVYDRSQFYVYRAIVSKNNNPVSLIGLGGLVGEISVDWVNVNTYTSLEFGYATPPSGWAPSINPVYDPADNTMVLTDDFLNRSIKITVDGLVVMVADPGFPMQGGGAYFNLDNGLIGGTIGSGGGGYWAGDVSQGTYTVYPGDQGLGFLAGNTFAYNSGFNGLIMNEFASNTLYIAYLQRPVGGEVPIANIIADICSRAGLAPDQIDTSAVTQTTIGYAITEPKSAGECLSDLLNIYQIDMVESDYTLKFVPKGQAPIVTLTQDQLGLADPTDPSKYWQEKDTQQQELPLQLNIRYTDPLLDYQPGSAYAKRTSLPVATQYSRRVKSVDLPVVATNAEARAIGENWLYQLWTQTKTYQAVLGPQFLYLDPTDVITVNLENGDSYTTRIESNDIGADYSIQATLASDNANVYVPSGVVGASVSYVPQTLTPGNFLQLFLMNVPLLLDTDDLGGTASRIYYAAGPIGTMSSSAVAFLYNSTDGGTFPLYDTIYNFSTWATMGSALAAPGAVFTTDYENTITVTFPRGATLPVSCSYWDMMSGANPALIGSEIICYQNANQNVDGSVTLSILARGCRGTEWAVGGHVAGEYLVLLQAGQTEANKLPLGQINQTEFWKLVPVGRTLDQAPTVSFAYKGYDLMPYAPVQIARAASGSDLVLSWLRRSRIGGWQQDGTDTTPISEESESYELYILASAGALAAFDPTNPTTYVRAFTGLSSATVTYTSAEMATDGFTPATETLYLCVYQVSAVVGRGFQAYAALAPF